MKRILYVILCTCLLFSACTPQNTAPSSQPPSETPPPTSAPSETQEASLSVYTDDSHYTPREPIPSMYSRMQEEWIEDLKPSDSYGRIYPFAGSATYESWREDYTVSGYLYGMIDEQGRIIADAAYSDISLLRCNYLYDFIIYGNDYLPLWVLSKTNRSEDGDVTKQIALASLDGSFVTDCIYSSVTGFDEYAVAMQLREDGSSRFDLYDLSGALLLRSEDLPCLRTAELQLNQVYYSDGMFRLDCLGGEWVYCQYYTDLRGQKLLGPYSYGNNFSCGYAVVILEDGNYGYIDRNGELLNDMDYAYCDSFQNGVATATRLNGDGSVLLDTEGRILVEAGPGEELYQNFRSVLHISGNTATFYDTQGNVLYGGSVPSTWEELGDGYFFSGTEIVHKPSGEAFSLDAYHPDSYVLSGIQRELPYFIIQWWDYDKECNFCSLLSSDFSILEEAVGYVYFTSDPISGEGYLLMDTANQHRLYVSDPQHPPVTLSATTFSNIYLYSGRILYTDEYRCAYYDMDGTLLFSYPLSSIGGD